MPLGQVHADAGHRAVRMHQASFGDDEKYGLEIVSSLALNLQEIWLAPLLPGFLSLESGEVEFYDAELRTYVMHELCCCPSTILRCRFPRRAATPSRFIRGRRFANSHSQGRFCLVRMRHDDYPSVPCTYAEYKDEMFNDMT